jgi:hypothetical protein
MVNTKTIGGMASIFLSSLWMFLALYVIHGLDFEKYFMTVIILGLLAVVLPLAGWIVGIKTIASA